MFLVLQQNDGIFGALIVNQPSPLEPNSFLYDYDRSEENTLLISAVYDELFSGNLNDMSNVKPVAIRVNGEDNYK